MLSNVNTDDPLHDDHHLLDYQQQHYDHIQHQDLLQHDGNHQHDEQHKQCSYLSDRVADPNYFTGSGS